jgi:hypothetical protein
MPETAVLVGPFRRPAFAEGLAARLSKRSELSVTVAEARDLGRLIAEASGPVVLILDRASAADALGALPADARVSAIVIGDEGREVRVSLRDVSMAKLDAIVALARDAARRVAMLPRRARP